MFAYKTYQYFLLDRWFVSMMAPTSRIVRFILFEVYSAVIIQPSDRRTKLSLQSSKKILLYQIPKSAVSNQNLGVGRAISEKQVALKGNKFQLGTWKFVSIAENIAEQIEQEYGFKISVVNARFIKPLDKSLLINHAHTHNTIITIEDNVVSGGFGSAVLESLNRENLNTQVVNLGWPDQFIPHGSDLKSLRENFNLDRKNYGSKYLILINATNN